MGDSKLTWSWTGLSKSLRCRSVAGRTLMYFVRNSFIPTTVSAAPTAPGNQSGWKKKSPVKRRVFIVLRNYQAVECRCCVNSGMHFVWFCSWTSASSHHPLLCLLYCDSNLPGGVQDQHWRKTDGFVFIFLNSSLYIHHKNQSLQAKIAPLVL